MFFMAKAGQPENTEDTDTDANDTETAANESAQPTIGLALLSG